MKHTILGLQQNVLIEYGMTLEDALILERMIYLSHIFPITEIDGKFSNWINYDVLKNEIPIVANPGKKRSDKVTRSIAKMEKIGLFTRIYKKSYNKTRVYFVWNNDKMKKLLTTQNCVVSKKGKVITQNCGPGNNADLRCNTSGIESSGIFPDNPFIDKKALHNEIKQFFKKHNPDYQHNGMQAANIETIIRYCKNEREKIVKLLIKYINLVRTSKENFWHTSPITPRGFVSKYEYLMARKQGEEVSIYPTVKKII